MRTARALAGLFEFEEFEQEFEEDFENESRHAPTLRVAADLIAQRAVRKAGPKSSLNKLNREKPKVNIEK